MVISDLQKLQFPFCLSTIFATSDNGSLSFRERLRGGGIDKLKCPTSLNVSLCNPNVFSYNSSLSIPVLQKNGSIGCNKGTLVYARVHEVHEGTDYYAGVLEGPFVTESLYAPNITGYCVS